MKFIAIAYLFFFISTIAIAAAGEERTLNAWIEIAANNNRPLKTALKKIELSEGYLLQARRGLFPELVFSYQDKDGKVSGLEYDGVVYKGKMEKTVFDGGRSLYALSRQKIELEKARKEYEKLRGELVFSVSQVYWRLAGASISRDVYEDIFRDIEKLSDEAERLYCEKLITQRQYLEIKSQVLKALVKRNALERDEKIAELEFRHIVNIGEEAAIDAAGDIPFTPAEVALSGLWDIAQRNRLERQIANMEEGIEGLNFLIAKRQNWPEVGASFSYGSSAEDYKFNRLDLDDEWEVLASVTLNIGASSLKYKYDKEQFTPVVGSFRGQELETHSVDFSIIDRLDKYNEIREKEIKLDETTEKKRRKKKRSEKKWKRHIII